jgi:hypothetical protein
LGIYYRLRRLFGCQGLSELGLSELGVIGKMGCLGNDAAGQK